MPKNPEDYNAWAIALPGSHLTLDRIKMNRNRVKKLPSRWFCPYCYAPFNGNSAVKHRDLPCPKTPVAKPVGKQS